MDQTLTGRRIPWQCKWINMQSSKQLKDDCEKKKKLECPIDN